MNIIITCFVLCCLNANAFEVKSNQKTKTSIDKQYSEW